MKYLKYPVSRSTELYFVFSPKPTRIFTKSRCQSTFHPNNRCFALSILYEWHWHFLFIKLGFVESKFLLHIVCESIFIYLIKYNALVHFLNKCHLCEGTKQTIQEYRSYHLGLSDDSRRLESSSQVQLIINPWSMY